MLRRAVGVVLASSCVVLGFVGAADAKGVPEGPEGDAFYAAPDPLPKAKPGSLIRAQPITAPAGANGWRILYHSRSLAGDDIAVSGVAYAPSGDAPKGGRAVVTWGHGGAGLADECAPSRQFVDIPGVLVPSVDEFIARDLVAVATDYEGLGTDGVPAFLVGESAGRSMLDAARAVRGLPGVGANKRVVIAGHSEGGQAALLAGELAPTYARELDVLGVMAGAPPANLEIIMPAVLARPAIAGYGVMAVLGFNASYPKADPADVLTAETLAATDVLDTECAAEARSAFANLTQPLTVADPTTIEPWAHLITRNSAGNRPTKAPLLVIQGSSDPTIPKSLTDQFIAQACAAGDTLEYKVYAGANHDGALTAATGDILLWLDARLAGDPATSTC